MKTVYNIRNNQKVYFKTSKRNKNGIAEFPYIEKSVFDVLKKNHEADCLGIIDLDRPYFDSDKQVAFISTDCVAEFKYFDVRNKRILDSVKKYVYVGENNYVGIVGSNKQTFALIILSFLFLFCISFVTQLIPKDKKETNSQPEFNFEDTYEWNQTLPQNGKQNSEYEEQEIFIPGYFEFWISPQNKYIELINPDMNSVYLKYQILEEEKLIHETDGIEPGKAVCWDASALDKGTHELKIIAFSYDI